MENNYELSAEELFYEVDMIPLKPTFEDVIHYCEKKNYPCGGMITFDFESKKIKTTMSLSFNHIKAIYKKMEEMGW